MAIRLCRTGPGNTDLPRVILEHNLIESISSSQLAVRLLILAGSRVLELRRSVNK